MSPEPFVELTIHDGWVSIFATIQDVRDIKRRSMHWRLAGQGGWVPEESRWRYIESEVQKHGKCQITISTLDNGWSCVMYALQNKNLVIVEGHEYLSRTTWDHTEF